MRPGLFSCPSFSFIVYLFLEICPVCVIQVVITLTDQTAVLYTREQVENIVEMIIQKLFQRGSVPTETLLDNSISQQPKPSTKMTLSVNEAAELIGISRPKVYDLLRDGTLPSIHVGKKIVIPRQAVIDWLSEGESNGKETC